MIQSNEPELPNLKSDGKNKQLPPLVWILNILNSEPKDKSKPHKFHQLHNPFQNSRNSDEAICYSALPSSSRNYFFSGPTENSSNSSVSELSKLNSPEGDSSFITVNNPLKSSEPQSLPINSHLFINTPGVKNNVSVDSFSELKQLNYPEKNVSLNNHLYFPHKPFRAANGPINSRDVVSRTSANEQNCCLQNTSHFTSMNQSIHSMRTAHPLCQEYNTPTFVPEAPVGFNNTIPNTRHPLSYDYKALHKQSITLPQSPYFNSPHYVAKSLVGFDNSASNNILPVRSDSFDSSVIVPNKSGLFRKQLMGKSQLHKPMKRVKITHKDRRYKCNWPGCVKAYMGLEVLNTHIKRKSHGPRRKEHEFRNFL